MKRKHWKGLASALLATLVVAFLGMGCESSEGEMPDAAEALRLDPAEATVEPGGAAVTLRVVNGRPPYRWQVADATQGALTGVPGGNDAPVWTEVNEVNYRAAADADGVNTVTVTDKRGWSATSRMRIAPEAEGT